MVSLTVVETEQVSLPMKLEGDSVPGKDDSVPGPPGINLPPGFNMAPPGLNEPTHSARKLELASESQRLQDERQRLMNERLELETARLAHENLMLRASLQCQMPMLTVSPGGPPGAWASSMATPSFGTWTAPMPLATWNASAQQLQRNGAKPSKASVRKESQTFTVASSDAEASTKNSSGSGCEETSVPETTVMMRNIPNSYTRERLLGLLDTQGFGGCYDLVYLPIDFTSRSGLGYSFINFVSAHDAKRFREYFHGFDDWGVFSEKACDAHGNAAHQGIEANIERYRNSPMMHESVPDDFRPALFLNGVRVPFPPPTRRLRAPDFRRRNLSELSDAIEA